MSFARDNKKQPAEVTFAKVKMLTTVGKKSEFFVDFSSTLKKAVETSKHMVLREKVEGFVLVG